jgi:hypothetical protein
VDYRFEVKALPPSQDPAAQGMDPAAEQPPELQPPHPDDARPWAGDAYDEGDETDPAQAYASFTGSNGEQAWLDKAEDGTLTGWVRDESGQVWRYSDPDTWAIDVDDAAMAQSGGTGDQPDPAAQDPAAQDPAMQDPAAGDPAADPAAADDGGLALDYGTADEAVPNDPAADEEDPYAAADDGSTEDPEKEPDDGEDPKKPKKKKGKPWE